MGFSISTEIFANITGYKGRDILVYKDASATGGVSEQIFYYTPLFSLVSDETGQPVVTTDEKTVEVLFQCYTEQLHNLILNEIRTRIGSVELSASQISLVPLIGIKLIPEFEEASPYTYPNTGLSLIPLGVQHEAKFKFSNIETANKFATRVRSKAEDFYIELTIPSVGVTEDKIDISAGDFRKVDWKNFVNDNNAEKNIDAENQFFTLDQISDAFQSILRRINITIVSEAEDLGAKQLTLNEKNELLGRFIEDLTKVTTQDFPPSEATDMYIGKESFKPDVINKEQKSISEAMTSSIERVIDTAQEDIRDETEWNKRESLLEQLDKEYKNKKGSGGLTTNLNLFEIFGGSSKGTANFDFTSDLETQMRTEAKGEDFKEFSSATKARMRSELNDLLQTQSNFEWERVGETIVPKKIKLRRIISGEFKANHQLLQKHRSIKRSVTEIGFPISSKLNLISLQELSSDISLLDLSRRIEMSWFLVYEHDEKGSKVFGDLATLINMIEKGAKVRILTKDNNTKSVFDADFVWVTDGVVFAQNTQNISIGVQPPSEDKQVMHQSDSYHYFVIVNTNGFRDAIRWLVGEHSQKGHNQDKVGMKWFVG